MQIINKITEVPKVKNEVGSSRATHTLSLRGESGNERSVNPSCLGEGGRVCLFVYGFTVDRHGLRPRDDNTLFVIARRERSERRGNPSCLDRRGRLVSSLTGSQWIATGLRPRDDKSEDTLAMTRCVKR